MSIFNTLSEAIDDAINVLEGCSSEVGVFIVKSETIEQYSPIFVLGYPLDPLLVEEDICRVAKMADKSRTVVAQFAIIR